MAVISSKRTAVEVKSLYEGNADTNAFTDAEKTKLWNQSWTNTWNETATSLWAKIWWADSATPNNTDFVATSLTAWGILKKITWINIKAFLKTYFDTLYATVLWADDNYVTDAEKVVIWNTSWTNTGNQDLSWLETKTRAINAQTGTTYTLVLTDVSKLITLTNSSAITLTVPPNSSVAFAIGTQIDLSQDGAWQVTFAGWSWVTINSLDSNKKVNWQYIGCTLVKVAENIWNLYWNLTS